MLARAIPLVLLLMSIACGSPKGSSNQAPSTTDGDSQTTERGRVHDKEDVSAQGKQWGGWRWKGDRDNCVYIHENECFAKKATACKAAGCPEKGCLEKKGAPAKISCQE